MLCEEPRPTSGKLESLLSGVVRKLARDPGIFGHSDEMLRTIFDELTLNGYEGYKKAWSSIVLRVRAEHDRNIALTPMQRKVFFEMERGSSWKMGALQLGIAQNTYGNHIRDICQRLKVRGAKEAIAAGRRMGFGAERDTR